MENAQHLHQNFSTFADWGWVGAFFAFVGTLVPGITLALQWSLAIAGIVAAVCSARYHYKLTKKL
jgi:hypothetical protein